MKKFIEIRLLNKGYGEGEAYQKVLKDIDLDIEKGELCVILGPSGSGKSTLLNIIGGIDRPDSGKVAVDGVDLYEMNWTQLERYRRKNLGYIFQMYNLIPNLNVKENIEVGGYLSDDPLDVRDIMKSLGIYSHRNKMPNQLSGGQQQRTSIGRAVIKKPQLLLCDEPTGSLDYNNSKEILKLIEQISSEYGCTVIMVTHNEAISSMADHVVRLSDGGISCDERQKDKISAMDLSW